MITPSALNWLTVAFMVIIFGFIWRTLAAQWAEKPIGQAMSTIL